MPARGVLFREHVHVLALVGVSEHIPPQSSEEHDNVSAAVEVRLRNDGPHAEAAVDASLPIRIHNEQRLLRSKKRQFFEHQLAGAVAADSEVLVLSVLDAFVVVLLCKLQPVVKRDLRSASGFFPLLSFLSAQKIPSGFGPKHKVVAS